ncbi:MAG: fused MFS/spermidine synthase [Candidatus Yanofskybacteria bacterium]|nr:fused MFS/spermidine synthase [Candidatus Yanofskybacteria bacterium]
MLFKKYFLELIVFISGAVVMVLEIVGSRVVAPYIGTSIIVWTSLIGGILASLSIGYWWGGALADAQPNYHRFSRILFLSAAFILILAWGKDFILSFLMAVSELRMRSLLAVVFLFAPPSILLGMVSPFAVRLRMHEVQTSGSTVGRLYAISTAGSIFGTFITGFFLLSHLGTTNILFLLAVAQFLCSILASISTWKRILVGSAVLTLFYFNPGTYYPLSAIEFHDFNTNYHRVWIYDIPNDISGRTVRYLDTEYDGHQSGMFVDNPDELVFEYTKMYRLAGHFRPDLSRALLIGGGGYSYPKNFLKQFETAVIDVVEIDSGLTELAREYFALPNDDRLTIYHQDARVYLNESNAVYDVIIGDAFRSSFSIPYHLATIEAVRRYHDLLTPNGAMLLNVIGSLDGPASKLLKAQYATFQSVFPQVHLFPVDPMNPDKLQNILLVVFKSDQAQAFESIHPEFARYLQRRWTGEFSSDVPVLTDEFAPVEQYLAEALLKE